MTAVETKTYEITTSDGRRRRITIPATFKITYGAIVPGSKGGFVSGFGIRVWEATDKQRMVISDVTAFRDLSIPMEIEAVRKFGTEDWFADDGSWTGKKADLVERAWKPTDEIKVQPSAEAPEHPWDEDESSKPATIYNSASVRSR